MKIKSGESWRALTIPHWPWGLAECDVIMAGLLQSLAFVRSGLVRTIGRGSDMSLSGSLHIG